jgi:hypothetical protein
MTRLNQAGEPVSEATLLFGVDFISDEERDEAIRLILQHLKMNVVRTNASKHGATVYELRPED